MIKKVGNWVFGSFFRTMGRFFFFLFFGFLIATIISRSNIQINWTDLIGIETVKASQVAKVDIGNLTDSGGNWSNSSDNGSAYMKRGANIHTPQSGGASISPAITLPVHGDIYLSGYLSSGYDIFGNEETLYCNNFQNSYCNEWITNGGNSIILQLWINGYDTMCKIDWNVTGVNTYYTNKLYFNATCKTPDTTISSIYYYFRVDSESTVSYSYDLNISRSLKYEVVDSQQIIDSIENQTQEQIESQQICQLYDKNSIAIDNKFLNGQGIETNSTGYGITDYIRVDENSIITRILNTNTNVGLNMCFYNINKTKIGTCVNTYIANEKIKIPDNTSYIRFSISKNQNAPQYKICKNGNQALQDSIDNTDTSEANTTANNFFSNFSSQDNGGISSIITAPLQAISGLVNASCVQLELPIPYLENQTLILPCMSSIYTEHFGSLFTLYQTIIFGAIAYRMLVSIFMMIQGFKNPDDDKIEVVDL